MFLYEKFITLRFVKKTKLMKKYLIFTSLIILLISCQKPLYKYKSYDEAAFKYAIQSDVKDIKKAANGYKEIVDTGKKIKKNTTKPKRNTIPPGACADYAYLLLMQGDTTKAITFFDKEMHLYPESTTYITNLKKQLGL